MFFGLRGTVSMDTEGEIFVQLQNDGNNLINFTLFRFVPIQSRC